jgi:transcriptional regulator with PAS, ATPase and Fis domain
VDHEWRITSFNQAAEKITGIKRDDALKSTEALTIMDALKRNNYNRLAAARELGMHKRTLFRKINKLGLKLPRVDGRSGRNGST